MICCSWWVFNCGWWCRFKSGFCNPVAIMNNAVVIGQDFLFGATPTQCNSDEGVSLDREGCKSRCKSILNCMVLVYQQELLVKRWCEQQGGMTTIIAHDCWYFVRVRIWGRFQHSAILMEVCHSILEPVSIFVWVNIVLHALYLPACFKHNRCHDEVWALAQLQWRP